MMRHISKSSGGYWGRSWAFWIAYAVVAALAFVVVVEAILALLSWSLFFLAGFMLQGL